MSKKTIIVVEDEPDMAELVALRLRKEHYAVEVARDGAEGLRMIRARVPDLVVLDIMLPVLSGTDVLKELRADPRTGGVPVVLLTARSEEGDMVAGLHLGADDYVTKPFSMSVLVARIEAVLRRAESRGPAGKGVLSAGPIRVNLDSHQVDVDGKPVPLTLTEFRLLAAIISGRGRVLSRNQLIDHGMGADAVVTDRTIDVHLAALRRKLGRARRYVQTVRGVGYRLSPDQHEAE